LASVTLRVRHTQAGIRPFDPYRDFKAVVELIDTVFRDTLGPSGQATLAEMRRMTRGNALWRWLGLLWGKAGMSPGFVWVEDEVVVGSVSMRRAPTHGGYFIGNVVVHPDWRRQGIASALINAVLDHVSVRKGQWVGLEVRSGNKKAYRLYRELRFQEVGRTLHMLRPARMPWRESAPTHPALRRLRGRDHTALIDLVQTNISDLQHQVLGLRAIDYQLTWGRAIDNWLRGKHEAWWGIEEEGELHGAARVVFERGCYPNQLEILVAPGFDGRFEAVLVKKAVGYAVKKDIEVVLSRPTDPLLAVLREESFRELHELVQMRLALASRASV